MVTKEAVTKMNLDGRKQASTLVRNNAHGSIIPVRKGNGTNELWYTISYYLQPNNTKSLSMVLCVYSKKIQGENKNEKREERIDRRKNEKNARKRSKHTLRVQAEFRVQQYNT